MNVMEAKGTSTYLSEWGENALYNCHWDHISFQKRLGSRYDYTGWHGNHWNMKNFRTSSFDCTIQTIKSIRENHEFEHLDGPRQQDCKLDKLLLPWNFTMKLYSVLENATKSFWIRLSKVIHSHSFLAFTLIGVHFAWHAPLNMLQASHNKGWESMFWVWGLGASHYLLMINTVMSTCKYEI